MKAKSALLMVFVVVGISMTGCGTSLIPTATPTPELLMLATPTAVPANMLLVRVSEDDYAPLNYQDSAGQWTGLDVELTRALLQEAGFTPNFIRLPWSRALEYMKTGDLHVMMNVSKTDERSEYISWIGPERVSRMVLAVKSENTQLPITTLDDFPTVAAQQHNKFGIQQDTIYSSEFNERLNDPQFAYAFEFVPKHSLNAEKAVAGHILGFFEEEAYLKYMIAQDPDYADLALHSFVLTQENVYFGISKKSVSDEILTRLQIAYTRLEQNGVFEEIRNRTWTP